MILFHPLQREQLHDIVKIQLKRVEHLLQEQKIAIEFSEAALSHVVDAGYDPVYGARPLKRAIQREIENPLAVCLLEETFQEGDTVWVDCEDATLTFTLKSMEKNDGVSEESDENLEASQAMVASAS